MFNNSDSTEILILAAIAAAIVYRLYMTLGERRGFEKNASPDSIYTRPSSSHEDAEDSLTEKEIDQEFQLAPQRFHPILQQVSQINSLFSLKKFMQGASIAFEMILQAYARGNKEDLLKLLSEKTFHEFEGAIKNREENLHKLDTTLVKLDPPEIVDIRLQGTLVDITLKFSSEQTNILYNDKGEIIEGSSNQIEEVVDIWTFQRDLRSSDPNWKVVETGP